MKISDYFKLEVCQRELDFVDLEVNKDLPLFVNPRLILSSETPYTKSAISSIQSLFNELITLIKNGKKAEALEIIVQSEELNEIHLGFSKSTSCGRGFGKETSEKLVDSLIKSAAAQTGLIESIEDLYLFVDGVGNDRLSDLTGRAILKQLFQYTIEQCKLWNIPLQTGVASPSYWDQSLKEFKHDYIDTLVINGSVHILIPKMFVSRTNKYEAKTFVFDQDFGLHYFYEELISFAKTLKDVKRDKNGEPIITDELRNEFRTQMGATTNKGLASFLAQKHDSILPKFKKEIVDSSFEHLPIDDQEKADFAMKADELMKDLTSLPSGPGTCHDYEKLVQRMMGFLFCNDLALPRSQLPIEGGEQIVDIAYDRIATQGIFADLENKYKITCPIVFVECKNYSDDIGNPELAQINLRLGANGHFGVLCCRKLEERSRLIAKLVHNFKNTRNLIVVITDNDFLKMLDDSKKEFMPKYEAKVRSLIDEVFVG